MTYIVMAGGQRPETVERGYLEKGLGQTVISGGKVSESLAKRGDCAFPNRSDAWGVRKIEGGVPDGEVVDVRNAKYKGQIEFMDWGDPRGSLIVIRYLKGYQTLDMQYQNLVLNADANLNENNESIADASYIRLQTGDNVFGDDTDPYFIQFLKVHEFNGNSRSRNASIIAANVFREKSTETVESTETQVINKKFEALKIVNEASADNSLEKLRNLLRVIAPADQGKVEDRNLYDALMKEADFDPEMFLHSIEHYKKEVSDLFEKAKSYNVLDITKHGTIAAGIDKKEVLADSIPAKGEKMLEWMVANFLDSRSYNTVFALKQITDKL